MTSIFDSLLMVAVVSRMLVAIILGVGLALATEHVDNKDT